ncbi:MAG: SIR2 family protein [Saprospiraceae bacterium]
MESIDWTEIIDSIEADSCVLFVGPYAFQNEQGQTIEQSLSEYLELEKVEAGTHRRIKRYYKDDGLYLFKTLGGKNRIMKKLKDFYDSEYKPKTDFLNKIAQLPFSLIVNLSPDEFIQNTFEHSEIQLPYFQDFYNKNGEIPETYFDFNRKKPLLYNLLGSVKEHESLILTHDDLFSYLESFFAANKMHNNLKSYIQNAQTFIFLGLPIDKWYTQLLLRILKLNKPNVQKEQLKRLSSFNENGDTLIFTDQFYFNMTKKTHVEFINELYEECKEDEILKTLQTNANKPTFDKSLILEYLIDGEFEEVFEALEKLFDYYSPQMDDLKTTLLLINVELKKLRQSNLQGIEIHYDKKLAQLVKRLIELINKIEERMRNL